MMMRNIAATAISQAALALLPALMYAQSTPKILVRGVSPDRLAELKAAAPRANFVAASTENDALREIRDADAVIGGIDQPLLRAARKLRWVQVGSAGVENVLFPELVNSNIVLTNCKIIQGPEISDHAFALLLALTRGLNELIPMKADKQWHQSQYQNQSRPIELNGRTALIIGLGGIGTQIAQRAWAFGMQVLAVDPKDIPMSAFVRRVVKPDRLQNVLPEADVVFMSAPHTRESERMLGPAEFNLMK